MMGLSVLVLGRGQFAIFTVHTNIHIGNVFLLDPYFYSALLAEEIALRMWSFL